MIVWLATGVLLPAVKLLVQVPFLVTFTLTVRTNGSLTVIPVTFQISLLPTWVKPRTLPPITL